MSLIKLVNLGKLVNLIIFVIPVILVMVVVIVLILILGACCYTVTSLDLIENSKCRFWRLLCRMSSCST